MGGGSGESTKTTTQVLSPEQQDILKLAMPGVKDFAANVPGRYQGNTVAGFDPSQVAGQDMALGAAGAQGNLAGNAANAENFYTSGDIWNPSTNSNLNNAIGAAVRPITQQYQETVLPGIRSEAASTGNFGSSKAGVAEGIASRGYENAVGDTALKLVQNQYQTNVDAQLKALGLLPTVQGAQTVPATTTSGVGDVRQAMAQKLIGQDVNNFNYDNMAPFLQSQELVSLLSGIPGGGTTSVANNPTQNPWMQSLGGAAAGASLGTSLMPGFGTAAGAAGGAILPWLFK